MLLVFYSSLWAICVLIGNHPKNVERLLSCTSDNWTEYSVKKFLQSIKNNKGQTAEARDHASLICCSIKMYETHEIPHGVAPEEDAANLNTTDNGSTIDSPDSSGLMPLKNTNEEAAEYIQALRGSKGIMKVKYSQSSFPELNSEPFFRFNIVGIQCGMMRTLDSIMELNGVTEI